MWIYIVKLLNASLTSMAISRRAALRLGATAALGALTGRDTLLGFQGPAATDLERRIRSVIEDYGDQGFHRTGTAVDRQSGEWLFESVTRAGLTPARETFVLDRVDPGDCHVMIDGRRVDGLPLFDGAFTGSDGVSGRLGPVGSDSEIGLVVAAPNTAASGRPGRGAPPESAPSDRVCHAWCATRALSQQRRCVPEAVRPSRSASVER